MDYSAFILALLDWIKKCLEERGRDEVEDVMIRSGFVVRRGVTRILREQYFHGRALREEVDEAMAMLAEMDGEDRACLLNDAEAHGKLEVVT